MSSEDKHWSNTDERGTVVGIKILLWIYRVFGRRVLWLFMFPVITFIYLTGKEARLSSKAFFERAHRFDDRVPRFNFVVGLKHFCSFANSAFDKLDAWLGRVKREDITYHEKDVFPELIAKKQGAIFIGSHLGNLEVCRALGQAYHDVTINVLVSTTNAVKFNDALQGVNPDVSVNLIQVDQMSPALAILLQDKVDNGEVVVIVGDRTSITTSGRVEYVPFLGEDAAFSHGPFILASLLSCPVYWLFCLREKRGYKIVFEYVSDSIKLPRKERTAGLSKLINSYAKRLEHYAIRYPYQWFNFYNFWQKDDAVHRVNNSED